MSNATRGLLVLIIGIGAASACFEESHQELDDFAKLVAEEIHMYSTTQGSCDKALEQLKAFYDNETRQKKLAAAAVEIINNGKNDQDDYLVTTMNKLQTPVANLTDAVFAFVLQCKDSSGLSAVRQEAGQQVKKLMEAVDGNSVTRLYMIDDKLRDLLQTVLCVQDQATEERIARLHRVRLRKSEDDKVSGGLNMMGKVLNVAEKLAPPGNAKARERIKQVKSMLKTQKQMVKSLREDHH